MTMATNKGLTGDKMTDDELLRYGWIHHPLKLLRFWFSCRLHGMSFTGVFTEAKRQVDNERGNAADISHTPPRPTNTNSK